jgi:hypothetical protein
MPDRAASAVSLVGIQAYVSRMLSERLHHDLEVAERATGAFAFGVVIATFVAVAIGTTVYDIGKWLALW